MGISYPNIDFSGGVGAGGRGRISGRLEVVLEEAIKGMALRRVLLAKPLGPWGCRAQAKGRGDLAGLLGRALKLKPSQV